MQVFVTSKSLIESARSLDPRRANKQIIECNQIYRAASGETDGWKNHCITRLWENDLESLMAFAWACYYKLEEIGWKPAKPIANPNNVASLIWFGLEERIKVPHFLKLKWWTNAMRSHLLAKDEVHYSQFGWNVPSISGYYALNKERDWQKYSIRKEKS